MVSTLTLILRLNFSAHPPFLSMSSATLNAALTSATTRQCTSAEWRC